MPVAARPRSASSEDGGERRRAPRPSRGRRGRRPGRRSARGPAGRRAAPPPWRRRAAVRSIGARRIASKPPSSRSATKRRLMPRIAANSSVAQSTPAARLPESWVRSSPKRKMTKVVTANSAIAGSDCSVRSSARRSLPRIAAKARREGVMTPDRGRDRSAGPELQHPVRLAAEALRVVGDDDARTAGRRADQPPHQLAALGVEIGVGLVEQQQLGLVQDAAADRQALPHPRRELGDPLVGRGAPSRRPRAAPRSAPRRPRRAARAGARGSAGSPAR